MAGGGGDRLIAARTPARECELAHHEPVLRSALAVLCAPRCALSPCCALFAIAICCSRPATKSPHPAPHPAPHSPAGCSERAKKALGCRDDVAAALRSTAAASRAAAASESVRSSAGTRLQLLEYAAVPAGRCCAPAPSRKPREREQEDRERKLHDREREPDGRETRELYRWQWICCDCAGALRGRRRCEE
jgi:hypothetical protein